MSTAKATAARSYARIAGLPLRIDGYELAGAERALTAEYTRLTTVVTLLGRGHEGQGEDTTYATPNQPKRHSRTSPRPAPSTSSISKASQYEPSGAIAVAADAELYRRVLRAFPTRGSRTRARRLTPPPSSTRTGTATPGTLRAAAARPIRCSADIARRSPPKRMINMKPSCFGSVQAFLDAQGLCERARIRTDAGGQFGLGPGRRQVQLLASLFSPDAPTTSRPPSSTSPSCAEASGALRPARLPTTGFDDPELPTPNKETP